MRWAGEKVSGQVFEVFCVVWLCLGNVDWRLRSLSLQGDVEDEFKLKFRLCWWLTLHLYKSLHRVQLNAQSNFSHRAPNFVIPKKPVETKTSTTKLTVQPHPVRPLASTDSSFDHKSAIPWFCCTKKSFLAFIWLSTIYGNEASMQFDIISKG